MKAIKTVVAALIGVAVIAGPALAFTGRGGDAPRVGAGEVINDDLYMAGSTVTMSGRVAGDFVAAGGTVNAEGQVGDDLILAGGTLNVDGRTAGSARLAGGAINVRGPIAGDLVATGGTVTVSGTVGRDLVLGAGDAVLGGTVGGKVLGGAGNLTIRGTVNGPVDVEVGQLTIARGAVIRGALVYHSDRDAIVEQGAQVGEIRRAPPRVERTGRQFFAPWRGAGFGFLWRAFGFVWLLLLGLMLVAAAPNLLNRGAQAVEQQPGSALLAGFIALVAIPAAAIVAMITVVGIPLGVIALLLYGILVYVSHLFAGMAIGRLVLRGGQTSPYAMMTVGLLLLALASAVPYFGGWVRFAAVLFGFGAIYLSVREAYGARRAEGAV